jgi:response regulator NasT
MRSLLVIDHLRSAAAPAAKSKSDIPPRRHMPDYILENHGYHVIVPDKDGVSAKQVDEADAVVLHVPLNDIQGWGKRLLGRKTLPMLWWCSHAASTLSLAFCESELLVDGILTPSMSEGELHWALLISSKQCMERQQWRSEKRQLEARLEERNWIEMAKGILCKLKNISEAEAYDILRKQAMNERKRMVDVATSIVKVHQILQSQK